MPVAQFGDRLRFVVWLSAQTLGVDSGKELAAVLKKGSGQLSSWVNEKPRPSWDNIRLIADTVGVNARWLDDPMSKDAVEPELFAAWWKPRAEKLLAAEPQRRRA